MKQILIIRHAKSSWDQEVKNDFDRPLNERGNRDAPVMAKRLIDKKIAVDAFISSPAKRAINTAAYFAEAYKKKRKEILVVPSLYLPEIARFYEAIEELNDGWNTVALFSHNPGITGFANELTSVKIDNLPTCGIFAVKIQCTNWNDFQNASKKFWFFDYPKLKS